MASFAASSLRFLRGLLLRGPHQPALLAGSPVVLEGLSAVATTEARISECAALSATYPASAGARVWSRHQAVAGVNDLGRSLTSVCADSPRGALAAAIGITMSGQRASVFLSAPDLATAQDLLMQAAGQHVPLVAHLACRAVGGQSQALGSGHEAYMAAGDTGVLQLFAANAQEAVDLAMVARRAAERALIPAIVATDGEQTAAAVQEVRLPDPALVREFVGDPNQSIDAPTDAQRMLFGPTRHLVPRIYDLERPMMLSALQGPESWAHGRAASRPYFCDEVERAFDEAAQEYERRTGRSCEGLLTHRLEGAKIALVAMGAAVETAIALADRVRAERHVAVGVLGIRRFRPLPGSQLAYALKDASVVAVLERLDTPLAGEGPLLRELRAVFGRVAENARYGRTVHPGYPTIDAKDGPRFVGVPYGLGGLPLRAADLAALVRELEHPKRSLVYLGLDFVSDASAYPKRQTFADALRRSHGDLASLGLRTSDAAPDIRPKNAITIAFHRSSGDEHGAIAADAAALIFGVAGGQLRGRAGLSWQRAGEPCTDWLTHAPAELYDPGDDVAVEIAMLVASQAHPLMDPCARLLPGGTLLVAGQGASQDSWAALPPSVRRAVRQRAAEVRVVSVPGGDANAQPWYRCEALLGGLLAVFCERAQRPAPSAAKLRELRAGALTDVPEDERERRLDVLVAAFGAVERLQIPADDSGDWQPEFAEIDTPALVRRLGRADATLECLPRFWDQVGVLYRSGQTDELWADPYLATAAVPPLSAAFRDLSGGRRILPVFDPASCDGSGRLWTSCPDGSVAALAISPKALIEAGIELASAKGKPADSLRGVVGRLSKRVLKIIKDGDAPANAGELLTNAFSWLMERTEDAERKTALEKAFAALLEQIGELPVARTEPFFDAAEKGSADSGELFSLIVNPDACKSPELILARCEGHGLKAVIQTPEALATARRLWNLWQELPDTSGQTIERLRDHPQVGPLAAMMLSRHCALAMIGGDGAEAGSGAKLALRQVLAAAEYKFQPRLQRLLEQTEELREKLAASIREVLAAGLPTGDLDALAAGLDELGSDSVDLGDLSAKVDAAVSGGRVDGSRLARLVEVARGLADLQWKVAKGPDGLGRARVGLAVAPSAVASWCAVFPFNPFQNPVAIDASGETAQLARGLLEGQLRQALSGVRLLRWARLELERPNEAAQAARALSGLRFEDLTPEERTLCPPVLVVGDDKTLGDHGLAQIVWLLDSGLPVKIVVLGEIGGRADGGHGVDALGSYPAAQRFDLVLLALLSRRAFVAQTSLATGEHFVDSVTRALAFDGPALVHVHAPSPQRHGFAADRLHEQARLAVATRAFPLLVFDPRAPGVFGSRLELAGNPDAEALLCRDGERRWTPVDWALTEKRFSLHFAPLGPADPEPTEIADYLALGPQERSGRTPFVSVGSEGEQRRLRVAETLVSDAEERLRLWQTLQELAGVVTPFVERVRELAEHEIGKRHQQDLEALKREYEAKIASLRAEFEVEATGRVARGLMVLAGYGNGEEQA